MYDKLSSNSKSFRRAKHHGSPAKPNSNRITPF